MLNKVQIIGNIGRDAEIRDAGSSKVSEFSVAVTEKYKDNESTEWFNIQTWNKTAESLTKHLVKGRKVYVEGKLKTQTWEKDGEKKYKTIVNAQSIQIVDWGKDKENLKSNQSEPIDQDDDLPF